MKGITKFAKRTPHMLTSRVGMAAKSNDAQFDDLNRKFTAIEKFAERLVKDSASFRDAVKNMLLSGAAFGTAFANLFQPILNEYDLERKNPDAQHTIVNIPHYQQMMDELRETLTPEIDLIETRVVAPIKEFESVLKAVRKNITKRDHKLIDFDRVNNSFSKLKEKKEKSLKDEQNLFKLEQEFEAVSADYEYYNNAMKEELPVFFEKVKALMSPLFHSFYYMQLNVFYLTLDKVQTFSDGKYDLSTTSQASVEQRYAEMLTDAAERLEQLSIRKPATPSARILATAGRPSLGSSNSGSSSRAGGLAAGAPSKLGGPVRQNSSGPTSPPPYGTGSPSSSSVAKKAPPPPPPMKPKPSATPAPDYVVALYDYTATADGDLSFRAGDRIQVVERTGSTEDWWTGTINGSRGVFPGNYVRDE